MIKAFLSDFDGTLVTKDILDVVCGIVGKEEESRKINDEFQQGLKSGIQSLIERINLLKGITYEQIKEKLDKNNYLMPGVDKLMNYLKEKNIVTILYSGNIEPILRYYQERLGIDYIAGTKPKMHNNTVVSIGKEDFPLGNWKVLGIEPILTSLSIEKKDTVAIGNSLADRRIIAIAGYRIAINPIDGIDKKADAVIYNDLSQVIPLLNDF